MEVRLDGAPDPLDQYVWDVRYVDAPVVRFHDSDTDGNYLDAEDNILYYTTDANWNVTALVDGATGEVVERYMYDPYGKATVCDEDWTPREDNASAVANDVLYCGYRFDAETGLYQVRFRYYHPTLGRWETRDMVEEGTNVYQYVGDAPLSLMDPYGMWKVIKSLDIYEAETDGESLTDLVRKANVANSEANWVCIRPRPDLMPDTGEYKTAKRRMPEEYKSQKAPKCARYDIGNLNDSWTSGDHELALRVDNSPEVKRLAELWGCKDAKQGFRGSVGPEAKWGRHPLTRLVAMGHCSAGGSQSESAYDLLPAAWSVTYDNARLGKLPPMCWFTHGATIWVVGCETSHAAGHYATLVRQDVTIWGTTRVMVLEKHTWGMGFRDRSGKYETMYNNMPQFLSDPSWVSLKGQK